MHVWNMCALLHLIASVDMTGIVTMRRYEQIIMSVFTLSNHVSNVAHDSLHFCSTLDYLSLYQCRCVSLKCWIDIIFLNQLVLQQPNLFFFLDKNSSTTQEHWTTVTVTNMTRSTRTTAGRAMWKTPPKRTTISVPTFMKLTSQMTRSLKSARLSGDRLRGMTLDSAAWCMALT